MDKAALAELRERVEAATGPSDILDADLLHAIYPEEHARLYRLFESKLKEAETNGLTNRRDAVWRWVFGSLRFTASIDAAVALVKRLLPTIGGNCWGFDETPHGIDAYVSRNYVNDHTHWMHEVRNGKTLALTLILALLKALEAKAP